MRYRKKWNSIFKDLQFENSLPVKLSFSIRITHNNTFYKYQQNWSFNIFFIWQNLRSKTLFRANFKKNSKGLCFTVEKFQIINIGEAVKLYQNVQNIFWNLEVFHKIFDKSCLEVGKIKTSEFQKLYVWRHGNRKQTFFITFHIR